MKYDTKTFVRRFLFLMIGVLFVLSAACGSASQLQPELAVNSHQSSSLQASSGALPTKQDEQQKQPVGVSQPAEAALQKAPETIAQQAAPAAQPVNEANPQAAAAGQPAAPAPILSSENLPATAPQVGFLAPDFTLQTLDGQSVRLSDLRGRPVLINYWTSWCVPCKEELPALEHIYRDYQGQGLVILSINAIEQDTLADAQQSVQQYAMSYPVLLDQGDIVWSAYEVMFFPTSFLVDRNGIIRDIVLGSTSDANFRAKIDQMLAGNG